LVFCASKIGWRLHPQKPTAPHTLMDSNRSKTPAHRGQPHLKGIIFIARNFKSSASYYEKNCCSIRSIKFQQ
jgi:hypothetical protein